MDKKRYQKYVAQQRELNKDKVCEFCGHEHDHTYGTGRFCSKSCYKSFVASKNKGSEKCKAHLDKLREDGVICNTKPYGTWKCEECNLIFDTRNDLDLHLLNADVNGSINIMRKYLKCNCDVVRPADVGFVYNPIKVYL